MSKFLVSSAEKKTDLSELKRKLKDILQILDQLEE